jgi:hypothetical protein
MEELADGRRNHGLVDRPDARRILDNDEVCPHTAKRKVALLDQVKPTITESLSTGKVFAAQGLDHRGGGFMYGCCAFQKASSTVETSVSPDRTTVVTCVLRYRHKLKLESEGQEAFAQVSGSVSTKLDP